MSDIWVSIYAVVTNVNRAAQKLSRLPKKNKESKNDTQQPLCCCANCQYVWPECGAKSMGCDMFSPKYKTQ